MSVQHLSVVRGEDGDLVGRVPQQPHVHVHLEVVPGVSLVEPSIDEQLLYRNVQWFRGGLVFQAQKTFASLESRLESNRKRVHLVRGRVGRDQGVWAGLVQAQGSSSTVRHFKLHS